MINIFDKGCHYDESSLNAMKEIIKRILSILNLELRKVNLQKYIIIEKKIALPLAIQNVPIDIGILLIQHLDIKNTLEDKNRILKGIANYFEGEKMVYLKSSQKYVKDLFNDINYYFNNFNIRHNNINEKKLTNQSGVNA